MEHIDFKDRLDWLFAKENLTAEDIRNFVAPYTFMSINFDLLRETALRYIDTSKFTSNYAFPSMPFGHASVRLIAINYNYAKIVFINDDNFTSIKFNYRIGYIGSLSISENGKEYYHINGLTEKNIGDKNLDLLKSFIVVLLYKAYKKVK